MAIFCFVIMSYSLTVRPDEKTETDASVFLSGKNAKDATEPVFSSTAIFSFSVMSHSLTVFSPNPPIARVAPSGENATELLPTV